MYKRQVEDIANVELRPTFVSLVDDTGMGQDVINKLENHKAVSYTHLDVCKRQVVAMMCAQSGKTDGLILNTIGYYMSYYPAPIMIVQPTVNLGESFSKDRLATMIRDTPVLRGLVDNKSRYSGNTIMKKNFAGGQLTIVGANAPTDLRGRPIKVLLADEVDAYKASAGKEGGPVMLAEQRQTTYWDYKTVLVLSLIHI